MKNEFESVSPKVEQRRIRPLAVGISKFRKAQRDHSVEEDKCVIQSYLVNFKDIPKRSTKSRIFLLR